MIVLRHINAGYAGMSVIQDLSLHIKPGELVAVAGANAAGKSTLLKVITGQIKTNGKVLLNNTPIAALSGRERAAQLTVMPQELPTQLHLSAREFVILGRTALLSHFGQTSPQDHQAVEQAMKLTATHHLGDRNYSQLSCGEQQRLVLAMSLVNNPKVLLLDEPSAYLDLHHATALLKLLQKLNQERNMTIVAVMHNLTLASCFFNRIILMHQGSILADGSPVSVLQREILSDAYKTPLQSIPLDKYGAHCIIPDLS